MDLPSAGIIRIEIAENMRVEDGKVSRKLFAQQYSDLADDVYRDVFERLDVPLLTGGALLQCAVSSEKAKIDWLAGIDVILQLDSGEQLTVQEKILNYHRKTATFEERTDDGRPGSWYTCLAQYYFIGYVGDERSFADWILLDYPAMRIANRDIKWEYDENREGNRCAFFRYVDFDAIPSYAIVARR